MIQMIRELKAPPNKEIVYDINAVKDCSYNRG
jgi:hypothetical protein